MPTLTITNLVAASKIKVFDAGTTTEVASVDSSGTSFASTFSETSVDITIHKPSHKYIEYSAVDTSSDVTIMATQISDPTYVIGSTVAQSATDTTAPILSNAVDISTGQTTATIGVDTDEANGTLYWVLTQSATPPSIAQIKAGNNHLGATADDSGSQAVSATGTQTIAGLTGLTAETTYYAHFVHTDVATNDSNVLSGNGLTTDPADATAPILSSPTNVATGQTTATIGVSTDEGNGTLYWVLTQSATPPSATQIKAGNDHLGAVADDSGSQVVSTTGIQTIAGITGLTEGTTYYPHFIHTDAATNDSDIVSGTGLTTDPAADLTAPILSSPTNTATGQTTASIGVSTDEGNGTLYWVLTQSATQPSAAQIKAGNNHLGSAADDSGNQSVSSTGAQSIAELTGLTDGTTYYPHFIHTDAATNDSNIVSGTGFTTSSYQLLATASNPTSETVDLWLAGSGNGPIIEWESGDTQAFALSFNPTKYSNTYAGTTPTISIDDDLITLVELQTHGSSNFTITTTNLGQFNTLDSFVNTGMVITGDINNLAPINFLNLGDQDGNTELTGDLGTYIKSVYDDSDLNMLHITGGNFTYTTQTWTTNQDVDIYLDKTGLSNAEIDLLLQNIDASGATGGSIHIFGETNGYPTSASSAARSSLSSKGFTLYLNPIPLASISYSNEAQGKPAGGAVTTMVPTVLDADGNTVTTGLTWENLTITVSGLSFNTSNGEWTGTWPATAGTYEAVARATANGVTHTGNVEHRFSFQVTEAVTLTLPLFEFTSELLPMDLTVPSPPVVPAEMNIYFSDWPVITNAMDPNGQYWQNWVTDGVPSVDENSLTSIIDIANSTVAGYSAEITSGFWAVGTGNWGGGDITVGSDEFPSEALYKGWYSGAAAGSTPPTAGAIEITVPNDGALHDLIFVGYSPGSNAQCEITVNGTTQQMVTSGGSVGSLTFSNVAHNSGIIEIVVATGTSGTIGYMSALKLKRK